MKLMLFLALMIGGGNALLAGARAFMPAHRAALSMSTYAEYLAGRQGGGQAAHVGDAVTSVVNEGLRSSTSPTYGDYLASQGAAAAPAAPVAPEPPAAASTGPAYADYLASRQGFAAAAPAAAAPAAAPPPATDFYDPLAASKLAPVAAAAPKQPAGCSLGVGGGKYDPWTDDELTVCTFIVNGVPKKYRIKM